MAEAHTQDFEKRRSGVRPSPAGGPADEDLHSSDEDDEDEARSPLEDESQSPFEDEDESRVLLEDALAAGEAEQRVESGTHEEGDLDEERFSYGQG